MSKGLSNSPWLSVPLRTGLARGEFFAVLIILGFANGMTNRIFSALEHGFGDAALHLFGINAVLWFALYAVARLGLESPASDRIGRLDLLIAGPVVAASLLPVPVLGTLSALSAAAWLLLTSAPGTPGHRMALIGLAISGPLLWGPIAMRLFAPEVVGLEAALIGGLTGLPTHDNVFQAADGKSTFVVFSACSSLLNVSLAFLLLVTLTQRLGIDLSLRLLPTALLAVVVTIFVNLVRLATIGFYPHLYHYVHEGAGSMMFGMASLLLMGAVVVVGVARVARPAV